MRKQQKIERLDSLIALATNLEKRASGEMKKCEDDVKAFIRNLLPDSEEWVKRIDEIIWQPKAVLNGSPAYFENAWYKAKDNFINVIRSIKESIELYHPDDTLEKPTSEKDGKPTSNKIFIVHGHNDTMKLTVARVVTQLGLEPVILHEQSNKGQTIIEKFERLSQDVGFAIVLLSADDEMADGKYRSRQNVILELGYFIAKLGRQYVVALHDTSSNGVEFPSDISGVLWEAYDKPDGAWRLELVQELQEAGFDVDANSLL